MIFRYVRYWGLFYSGTTVIGVGYSGQAGCTNEPSYEQDHNIGPLPEGRYTITSTDDEKGPLTYHLTPDPTNTMFGRSGFLIHGDNPAANHTASDGCIASPMWTRVIFKVGDVIIVV